MIHTIWHEIASKTPEHVLGSESVHLLNQHWSDAIAQPGYVGAKYQRGGALMVGNYPANGDDRYNHIHNALKRLATDESEFDNLNHLLAQDMPTWSLMKTAGTWALELVNMEFSEIAFINLCKWRLSNKNGSLNLYKRSWKDTERQIDALEPGIIILLGKTTSYYFERFYEGPLKPVTVVRSNGDKYIATQLSDTIDQLKNYRNMRSRNFIDQV